MRDESFSPENEPAPEESNEPVAQSSERILESETATSYSYIYGNGNGNIHYQGASGKTVLWKLESGVAVMYEVSKVVAKAISNPKAQAAIDRAICFVESLAGLR